jgi:hypothetical protein
VALQNTLLALNTAPDTLSPSKDCVGVVTSLGNNLIGDPADCTITLQASDLTGDPGLDAFTRVVHGVLHRLHVRWLAKGEWLMRGPLRGPFRLCVLI